jgi:hypothetical protein
MIRTALLAVAVTVGLLLSFGAVQAIETPRPRADTGCSGYAAYLHVARQCLEQDDRAGALAALREARTALATCLRESADETALAALRSAALTFD